MNRELFLQFMHDQTDEIKKYCEQKNINDNRDYRNEIILKWIKKNAKKYRKKWCECNL